MFHKIKRFISAWLFTIELTFDKAARQQLTQADQDIEQGDTVKLQDLL